MPQTTKADNIVLSMALALVVITATIVMGDFLIRCNTVREDSLRLHVLAASDDAEDQRLKLLVRDTLLEQYGALLGRCENAEQAQQVAASLSYDIKKTAEKALQSQGCADLVSVSVTEMYFDTRKYEDGVTLPAGDYDALRVVIGAGAGQNWWCVMYPPLCLPAAIKPDSTKVEQQIRSLSEQPCYEAKFAVVELFEKVKKTFIDKKELL